MKETLKTGSQQKRLVQRIERRLETVVDDAFARLFGGSIVREEVEAMLRREAADGMASLPGHRLLAPNEYIITLGVHDFDKVSTDPALTSDALAGYLANYFHGQGWQTYGDVVVGFEQSSNLRTGQFRVHGAVNPDVKARPAAIRSTRPQTDHAFSAEPGAPLMTENSSYRAGQGQGQPGDENQDPYPEGRYVRPPDDAYPGPDPRAGQDPRVGYPQQPSGYPAPPGYAPPRHPEQGGYPDRGGYPDQRAYQDPGGYPDQRRYSPPGRYPDQGGYQPVQGSHPDRGPAGYSPPPSYDPSYRQGFAGYAPPAGQPGYGSYGDYVPSEQRPSYPEQPSGYDQGYQGEPRYGQNDYGQGDPSRYGEGEAVYAPPGGGYPAPPGAEYDYGRSFAPSDYGQPAQPVDYGQSPTTASYNSYGQVGYPATGIAAILHLDDGSGRTYQLHEGSNVVGRGQDAQFRLPDTGVSRRHLEIRWDGQVALLADLNSTNGTTVNNAPVLEWQLADGDVIRVGHSEIIVRMH